jgi:hypothetical protein
MAAKKTRGSKKQRCVATGKRQMDASSSVSGKERSRLTEAVRYVRGPANNVYIFG